MNITDRVWGDFVIEEPVINELLQSRPVQRLKEISHYGIPAEYSPKQGFSRYDHSVGVMLALRKLGAKTEEQVAGLLHDVSHTAFSHVVDFVVGKGNIDNYQDNQHRRIIENSELPEILHRHGIPLEPIISLEGFPLLESPAPEVCADRLDYSVREFAYWLAPRAVPDVREGIKAINNKIVFKDFDSASIFARHYLRLQTEHWAGADAVIRYHILARALKCGMDAGILTISDLDLTDKIVLEKLRKSGNKKVAADLEFLSLPSVKSELVDSFSPGAFHRAKKFRYVDPEFIYGKTGSLIRVGEVDEEYREMIEEAREHTARGFWIIE